MGIYRTLHIKALKRRKKYILECIKHYSKALMEINRELDRYENN